MKVNFFRKNDIKIINKNIDNIMKQAKIKKNKILEPNIDEYKNVKIHVLNIIKEKKLIIKGGVAWDMLIKNKTKNEENYIYDDNDIYDIDVYSYEPIKDMKDICDYLATHKFKFIQGANAFHEETYKIYVNYREICNISYMPKYIFAKIDRLIIDGYHLIGNRIILIDLLRQFNDPLNSFFRLNKVYERGIKILKYYPLRLNTNGKDYEKLDNEQKKIGKLLFTYLCEDKEIIFIDRNILNIYINPNEKEIIYDNYKIEIITDKLIEKTKEIYKFINEIIIDNTKLIIEEYNKFFEFLDNKIVFKYDDEIILIIYGNNEYCTPYNLIKEKKSQNNLMIGTFNVCILYLIINLIYNKINNEKYDKIEFVLSKMFNSRDKYLNNINKSIIDDNIFKDFKIECYGRTEDNIRKYLKSIKFKNSRSKISLYDPNNEKSYVFNPDDYKFNNSSGNININFDINDYN